MTPIDTLSGQDLGVLTPSGRPVHVSVWRERFPEAEGSVNAAMVFGWGGFDRR
jgi:hypothetical protein